MQFNDKAFQNATSFEISNLPSLQSIDISQNCFIEVQSFSLIGKTEIKNRCLDLPQLQSIRLNEGTFIGDSNRRLSEEYPFKYNNTMIMRSRID